MQTPFRVSGCGLGYGVALGSEKGILREGVWSTKYLRWCPKLEAATVHVNVRAGGIVHTQCVSPDSDLCLAAFATSHGPSSQTCMTTLSSNPQA